MIQVSAYQTRLPHCCGAHELGEFREQFAESVPGPVYCDGRFRKVARATAKEAWEELLTHTLSRLTGYPIQFWFVRQHICSEDEDGNVCEYSYEEDYENFTLRELVKAYPTAVCISEEHINPNSDNLIEGWIIPNMKVATDE